MTGILPPPARALALQFAQTLAPYDVHPAADSEVAEGRALAARLIGEPIVSTEDFERVHARNRIGLFLAKEDGRMTGILAFVALNAAGTAAVYAGTFNAISPIDAHVASSDEAVDALYGWGVAADTRESAGRLVEGARAMGRGPAAHLAHYARPTTARGERLMREKLNFESLPGDRSGLVWTPPFLHREAA